MDLNRHLKLLFGLGAVVLVIVGKLFYIQIIDKSYKESSDSNSTVHVTTYPPRGLIYDRNGDVLVSNKISYDIMAAPKEIKPFDTLALAQILDTTEAYVKERLAYYGKYRTRIGYTPQTFIRRIDIENYMKFVEQQYMFPGFYGQVRTIRDYPVNACGNILGYTSEVDQDYIKSHPGEYKPGDYAGRTGIEASMEETLRGDKGYKIYVRDSRNRLQSSYMDGAYDKDAVPGTDITTTIDAELQQYGQKLMNGKTGSLIALEPSTGEILTMVSSPGIDTYMLSDISKYYKTISQDKNKPMFNRTHQASYPPGSVFKLVNGLAGLEEEVLTPGMRYPCHAGYEYSRGHKLGCHNHTSPLDLDQAIMMSCNGYFCYVLRSILENRKYANISEAYDRWREIVTSFGFGDKLGTDLPGELGGNIPTSAFYDKRYRKGAWKFPYIVSLSIGQGEIGATPLQIANLCATVANRGYYYIPHIVKDSDGYRMDDKYRERHYTAVDTSYFPLVIPGMWRAVNAGQGSGATAWVAAVDSLDICGKTGTAQNPHGKDHSVFICFAPKDNPRIAVAAYIENAGFGTTWACPIASLLVEKYLKGEISAARKPMEDRVLNTNLIAK